MLDRVRPPLVVLDPLRELVGVAGLVTPNLPELAVLVDDQVATDWPAALKQARKLSAAAGRSCSSRAGNLSADGCRTHSHYADGLHVGQGNGPINRFHHYGTQRHCKTIRTAVQVWKGGRDHSAGHGFPGGRKQVLRQHNRPLQLLLL